MPPSKLEQTVRDCTDDGADKTGLLNHTPFITSCRVHPPAPPDHHMRLSTTPYT